MGEGVRGVRGVRERGEERGVGGWGVRWRGGGGEREGGGGDDE